MKQLFNSIKATIAKRTLAFILSFAVLLSAVSGAIIFADTQTKSVWDGTATAPAEGNGEEATPYLIKSGSELAWAIQNGGNDKYYKLTSDIYLNDIDLINWSTGESTDPNYAVKLWQTGSFSGHIDGDGHVIYGLYAKDLNSTPGYWESTNHCVAFIKNIPADKSVTVKNLGFDNVYLHATGFASVLVAVMESTSTLTVDNCFIGENGRITSHTASSFITWGKSVKNPEGISISNSYSLFTGFETKNDATGFTGKSWRGTGGDIVVKNCYAVGTMRYAGTFTNCYSATQSDSGVTKLDLSNMKGTDVLTNTAKMSKLGPAFKATEGYPILKVFDRSVQNDGSYWDGTVSAAKSGSGTENDPYLIENGSELAWAITRGGNDEYYKLTADIYLNKLEYIDWATGQATNSNYTINKWKSGDFSGHIDGDGHVIYGLYAEDLNATPGYWEAATHRAAFIKNIPADKSVTVKNLGFDNIYLHATSLAAAVVGSMEGTATLTVDNCFVGAKGKIKSHSAGSFVVWGKGIKKPSGISISNSYSLFTDFDTQNASTSLTGRSWQGSGGSITVNNCYAVGNIRYAGTFTNCYSGEQEAAGVIKLDLSNMKGTDVLTNTAKMSKLGSAFVATDGYPVLRVFTDLPEEEPEGPIWSGKVATKFASGSGSDTDPYLIGNGAELALAITSGGNKYYKLTSDIYLNDITVKDWEKADDLNVWVTTNSFKGYINGDGHIVNGVYFPENSTNKSSGLVSNFGGGKIEKLGVRNSFIYATDYAGGIVGKTMGGNLKEIDMCFTDESVSVAFTKETNGGAGGILGYADVDKTATSGMTKISNCYSKAVLSAAAESKFRDNGIIGTAWAASYTLENCYSPYSAPYSASNSKNTSYLYMGEENENIPLAEIYKNVYTGKRGVNNAYEYFTCIPEIYDMLGEAAKTSMPGLDYVNVFETVEEGTPKLKIFTQIDGVDTDLNRNNLFASGRGTKDDPFVIKTVEHLRNLITSSSTTGKYYSLEADIYVNDTKKANWKENSPAAWYTQDRTTPFSGYFEGNGHTVYGLYFNEEPKAYDPEKTFSPTFKGTALFPAVSNTATILNVHVRDSYLKGPGYVGSIAGCATVGDSGKAVIIGCSADESVSLYGESVGGIVGGGGKGITLAYCYFTGKILYATPSRANGLIGDIWITDQDCTQCYSVGYTNYRSAPKQVKAVYGTKESPGTTLLTAKQMTGLGAKKHMAELDWTVWYAVNGKTPQLKVVPAEKIILPTYEGKKGEVWSGLVATGFAGGSGTEADPYLIETPEQLAFLVSKNYAKGGYYKLTADIKLNDTSFKNWQRKAKQWFTNDYVFSGHVDGNGHIVSGLYIDSKSGGKAALFPWINASSSIKRLGIVNSTIINPAASRSEGYAAAFVGCVQNWYPEGGPQAGAVMPVISECFADDTVYIEGQFAGGLVCGAPSPIEVRDCFFTGTLTYDSIGGGLIGNAWGVRLFPKIVSSYCSTADSDPIGGGRTYKQAEADFCDYVYLDGPANGVAGVKAIGVMWMRGENAKEAMKGLDFKNVWLTVDGGSPVLRCFKNAKQYTSVREGLKVEISFSVDGGTKCEPIYGYAGFTEIPELPVSERYGYEFGGWYCFAECDVPFTEKVFPDYNTVLFAKWIPLGFTVNFEGRLSKEYDYNSAVEHYIPGVKGYNPIFLHSGLKTMHVLGNTDEDALFLINYEDVLEVGKEYKMHFMMNAANDGAKGSVQLLHADHPQYDSTVKGYEVCLEFDNLKRGEWVEYTYTFTPNTPYVIFKVPAGVELFFDDVRFVPTGKDGVLGDIIGYDNSGVSTEPTEPPAESKKPESSDLILIISVIAGAVILLAVIVTVAVVLKRKKKSV